RVRKEGPNQGRLFLVCGDPACDSFEWASPPDQPRPAPAPRPAPSEGQRTEEGLLADIRDHPEDDAPRLIYADWLDEHEQPLRADLIRVQVERDRPTTDGPDRERLERRSLAILQEQEEGWTAPLRPLVLGLRYRRGLIDEIEVEADRVAEHGEEWLRFAPTAAWHVHVDGWVAARALVRCKALAGVRRLALLGERMGGAGARILAESPQVANLRSLSLAGQSLGQPGAQALAGSRYLTNLEALDLTACNLARSAVTLLAQSPNLPRLRRLVLADNPLGDADVRALAASPYLKELRELDLSRNLITTEAAKALAGSPLLGRLRWLNLAQCQVGSHGLYLLRQSPHASKDLVVRR
ncbi:MAG TPA: TIGR02996 domain-containing protein, partial [Gemmataceae bacterium]|nr:TIGR02996 domain-containing protein [Gemmataceae bacterium]